MSALPHHRIIALRFSGGFLDGARLELEPGLNCIIGGRGSGKTTVLEALRYGLDRMPDPRDRRTAPQNLDNLLTSNLQDGTLTIELETKEGIRYTVKRGLDESPLVMNDGGDPVKIDIGSDTHFDLDIYSQNEIEDIANNPHFQLRLIDKFLKPDINDLERDIAEVHKTLSRNARDILDKKAAVNEHAEAMQQLPDLEERLRSFEAASENAAPAVQKAYDDKAHRKTETDLLKALKKGLAETAAGFETELGRFVEKTARVAQPKPTGLPNQDLVDSMLKEALAAMEALDKMVRGARTRIDEAKTTFDTIEADLEARHLSQEKEYRDLIEAHQEARDRGKERVKLQEKLAQLKASQNIVATLQKDVFGLVETRQKLIARLSELRDKRFELRVGVAERLTRELAPMIYVEVEPFGDTTRYRDLLNEAMKGSRIQYKPLNERIVARMPPSELVMLIMKGDVDMLAEKLDIGQDRASRMILHLKDREELYELETVELMDHPKIQLKDGADYKDAKDLSTGQKCTTILPILLVQSERPLLIDQPEDNLDNAFVFETVVHSLRQVAGRRQLIFVTHNPNIPVLGDASRVFALVSDGRHARVIAAGTVDETAPQIMAILEGGKKAFEERRKRYQRPVPAR